MRILSVTEFSHASGGDSWGGTPEGQAAFASNPGAFGQFMQCIGNSMQNSADGGQWANFSIASAAISCAWRQYIVG